MAAFVDRVTVHVAAGNGGHGVASVHREKFKPLGGPDGGNGGDGGDVVLEVDPIVHTLLDFHHRPHQKAGNGRPGAGSNRHGARGEDAVLRVPAGTVVSAPDGRVIADLVGAGTRVVLAAGGKGGLGNAALANARRKAPGFALLGEPGEAFDAVIELKSIADVGLVGFPSAGKSSLIAAMSAARPKIADYPFTTLVPNLGVVRAGDVVFTMADVPGLIPGASAGKGLGLQFLRHVEHELREYGGEELDLVGRLRVAVLNKVDVPDGRELVDLVRPALEERGLQVFPVSAATGEGLADLGYALAEAVERFRATLPPPEPARVTVRPRAAPGHRSGVHCSLPAPPAPPAPSPPRRPRASAGAAPTPASTHRTGCAPRSGWPPRRPAGCPTSSATRAGPTRICPTTSPTTGHDRPPADRRRP